MSFEQLDTKIEYKRGQKLFNTCNFNNKEVKTIGNLVPWLE